MQDFHMLREAVTALNQETKAGRDAAGMLLKLPIEDWQVILDAQPHLMGLGTVEVLLDATREELDRDPGRALAITTFVVGYLDRIVAPRELEVIRLRVFGMAWKEYGNALFSTAALEEAAHAARRARMILGAHSALAVDHASATLLLALVLNAQARHTEADGLLAESEEVFAAHSDKMRWLYTIESRAVVLSNQNRDEEALAFWQLARAEAERIEDARELARIENNIGRCAAKLGRLQDAMLHLEDAARRFDSLKMDAEVQRARASIADVLQRAGNDAEALSTLLRIQQECGRRQMHELVRTIAEKIDELQEAAR
jgi:tetratricopeptide (TPR) repeat protein